MNVQIRVNSFNATPQTVRTVHLDFNFLQPVTQYNVRVQEERNGVKTINIGGVNDQDAYSYIYNRVSDQGHSSLIPDIQWDCISGDGSHDSPWRFGIVNNFQGVYDALAPDNWVSEWRYNYYRERVWPNRTGEPENVGDNYFRTEYQNPYGNPFPQQVPTFVQNVDLPDEQVNTYYKNLQKGIFFPNGSCFGVFRRAVYASAGYCTLVSGFFNVNMADIRSSAIDTKFEPHLMGWSGPSVNPLFIGGGIRDGANIGIVQNNLPVSSPQSTNSLLALCDFEYESVKYIGCIAVAFDNDGFVTEWNCCGFEKSKFYDAIPDTGSGGGNDNAPGNNPGGGNGGYGYRSDSVDDKVHTGEGSSTSIALNSFSGFGTYGLTWGVFTKSQLLTVFQNLSAKDTILKILKGNSVTQTGVFDAIKTVHMVPTFNVALNGTPRTKLNVPGFVDINVGYYEINNREVFVDCGTVNITNETNTYLDYAPYVSGKLFLPFIGTVPIEVDSCMGKGKVGEATGSVDIQYRIDLYTGDCLAYVTYTNLNGNDTVLQYSGNCKWDVPFKTGDSNYSLLASAFSVGKQTVSSIGNFAAGNVAGGLNDALGAATGLAQTAFTGHSDWSSVTGNSSCMGCLTPYIELYYPALSRPTDYASIIGEVSEMGGTVGTINETALVGFQVYKQVNVSGIGEATEAEKAEIERLLLEGVYL